MDPLVGVARGRIPLAFLDDRLQLLSSVFEKMQ
jgi:hypothetical protein